MEGLFLRHEGYCGALGAFLSTLEGADSECPPPGGPEEGGGVGAQGPPPPPAAAPGGVNVR